MKTQTLNDFEWDLECSKISSVISCELAGVVLSLAKFAVALSGSQPVRENKQWVFRPNNFVAFLIQPRKGNVKVSVYGSKSQFGNAGSLILKKGRENCWTSFAVERPTQLANAATCIQTAFDLSNFQKRGHRVKLV